MHQHIDSRLEELASEQTAQTIRLNELEARIAALEEAAARQVPWSWPQPTWPDTTKPMLDGDLRCGVCGGRYADMTHYVCSHPQCPSRITCGAIAFAGTRPEEQPHGETPPHLTNVTCATNEPKIPYAKHVYPPQLGDSVYGR